VKDVLAEMRLVMSYVAIVFRPGHKPAAHPAHIPAQLELPQGWGQADYERFIDEVRRAIDTQQNDKRDVRSRAQVTLTTALLLGGAVAAGGATHRNSLWQLAAFVLAFILVGVGALASAGVMTARSDIGAVNLRNLAAANSGELDKEAAAGYAAVAFIGSETVAVMVTVLRTSVLFLLLSFLVFALLYVVPS